jgi:hypothetical protein
VTAVLYCILAATGLAAVTWPVLREQRDLHRRQLEREARWKREDEAWSLWCDAAREAIRERREVPPWRKP